VIELGKILIIGELSTGSAFGRKRIGLNTYPQKFFDRLAPSDLTGLSLHSRKRGD